MPDPASALPWLLADEPAAFSIIRADGRSRFVLVCDHAGRRVPARLGDLGVAEVDLTTHIAWDIGAAGVAQALSQRLDAPLVLQTYSRLVIDCNRPLDAPDSIAEVSAQVPIPANQGLHPDSRAERVRAIFTPYHDAIRGLLDERSGQGATSVLVSIHSFTPQLHEQVRPWHAGVLYRDPTFARPLLNRLRHEPGLVVGDNQPYEVSAATDYTVIEHGERRGLLHVELEIRQDLVADASGQAAWAELLARVLPAVEATL